MSNDTITEAAMWRIAYRLTERDKEDRSNLKGAVNVEEPVFTRAIDLLLQVNLIEEVEDGVYRFKRDHVAADDWGGTIMKVAPAVREGGWPRDDEDEGSDSGPSQPPGEGTETRRILEAFNPGEPITSKEVSRRVYGREGKAVHSFISTLVDRGFVEKIGKTGNLKKYQLTERGEEVVE